MNSWRGSRARLSATPCANPEYGPGIVNLAHILGVSSLFGSVLILDLRLLGVWPGIALKHIATPASTMAGAGFAIAAATGLGLIATKATEYVGNPFFYTKFPAIALGVLNVFILRRLPAWKALQLRDPTARQRRQLAVAGGVSLTCWITAVTPGRMIGYW